MCEKEIQRRKHIKGHKSHEVISAEGETQRLASLDVATERAFFTAAVHIRLEQPHSSSAFTLEDSKARRDLEHLV